AADCKSAYAGSIPTQASTPDTGATHRRPRPGGEIGRHKGLEDLSPPGETPGVAPVKFGERPGPRSEPTPSQASGSPKEGVESRRRAPVAHRAKVKACSRPRTAMAGGESRSGTKIPRPRGHAGSSPAPGTTPHRLLLWERLQPRLSHQVSRNRHCPSRLKPLLPSRHRHSRADPRTSASPPYVIMAARHPGAPPPVPMFHRRTAWFACIAIAVLGIVLAWTWSPAWWWAVAVAGPLA